jgi:hypothetical protein
MSHVLTAIAALAIGIGIGWTIHASPGGSVAVIAPPATPAPSPVSAQTPSPTDQYTQLSQVSQNSPDYARAQRLLAWNYYAQQKHDLTQAKKHADLALAASPDDPKVLEDAGRVYVLCGLTDQGTAMLKRAGTPVALDFIARHPGN